MSNTCIISVNIVSILLNSVSLLWAITSMDPDDLLVHVGPEEIFLKINIKLGKVV